MKGTQSSVVLCKICGYSRTLRGHSESSLHGHRGTADQFCVLKSDENGYTRPTVAIEYKAPHKLTPHTIALGPKTEIDTCRDVISQIQAVDALEEHESEAYWCKYVMAAVVTQLFSYMVTQGTRFGYICTGQAYVFLRIGDDATNVYYSVHIPLRDFDGEEGGCTRLLWLGCLHSLCRPAQKLGQSKIGTKEELC